MLIYIRLAWWRDCCSSPTLGAIVQLVLDVVAKQQFREATSSTHASGASQVILSDDTYRIRDCFDIHQHGFELPGRPC